MVENRKGTGRSGAGRVNAAVKCNNDQEIIIGNNRVVFVPTPALPTLRVSLYYGRITYFR